MGTVNAGRAEVEVSLRDRIAASLPALERKLKATGANIAKLGAGVGAASGAGLGLFSAAAKSFAGAGTELVNLSIKTGVSVQSLSALEFAAARTGSTMDDVQEIIQAIKDGKGLELWASKSAGVLRLLKSDIGGLMQAGKQMGVVMSQQDAQAAVDLSIALSTSALMLKTLWNAVGAAVAPAVTASVERMIQLIGPLVQFIKQNKEVVRVLFLTLSVVSVVGTALAGLGAVIAGAGTALSFLSGAFLPLMVGAGILIAIGVAAYQFRDRLLDAWRSVSASIAPVIDGLKQLYGVFAETFGGILMALGSGQMQAAASIAWLGMVAAAWTGIDLLAEAVNTGIDYLQAWFPALDTVRQYFGTTFSGIIQAILAGRWDLAGQLAAKQLSMGWQAGLDLMRDGMDQWTAWTVNAFRSVVDFIYDLFFELGAWFSSTILGMLEKTLPRWKEYFAELREGNDRLIAQERKRIAEQRAARVDPNEAVAWEVNERAAAREALNQEIAAIEAEAAAAFTGAGSPTLERVAAQARTELTDAIAAARKEMERLGLAAPKLNFKMAQEGSSDRSTAAGTFSAMAATLLGAGDNATKQTALNTRMANQYLRRIANAKRDGATL